MKTIEWNNTVFELVETDESKGEACDGQCEFSELRAREFPCNSCLAYCDRKYYPKSIDK